MINNLQVLRAFSALLVILFHIVATSNSYGQPVTYLEFVRVWGACSVDIFFLISGFVMAYVQAKKNTPMGEFFVDRIVRIVPLYWLLTAALLVLYWLAPSVFKTIRPDMIQAISSFLFISTPVTGEHPLVYVGWTLEWEMLFYMTMTLSLVFKTPKLSNAFLYVALLTAVLLFEAYLVLDFMMGLFAGWLFLKGYVTRRVGTIAMVIGVVTMLASMPVLDVQPVGIYRVIYWGVPAFFLTIGCLGIKQTNLKLPIYLGTASYSIYLIQSYAISAYYKVAERAFDFVQGDVLGIICLIASTAIGCLLYEFVEFPITKFFKRIRKQRKAQAAAA